MTALLIFVGLGLLAYGGYSAVVLPKKPLARGQSARAVQYWMTGVLIAVLGAVALALGITSGVFGGLVGAVVAGGLVLGAGRYQYQRMLGQHSGG